MGNGALKSGKNKLHVQSNREHAAGITLLSVTYTDRTENENRSGIIKSNTSNMDIKGTAGNDETILNPSSAPETTSDESDEYLTKKECLNNSGDCQKKASQSDILEEKHVPDLTLVDSQKNNSDNDKEDIDTKNDGSDQSTDSTTKEDNDTLSTDEYNKAKSDSCTNSNTGSVKDVIDTQMPKKTSEGDEQTQNVNNSSLHDEDKTETSSSTQTLQQTQSNNSEHEGAVNDDKIPDKAAGMGNVKNPIGETNSSIDPLTNAETDEERKNSTEVGTNDKSTGKNNKNEKPKLSEYGLNENVLFYRNKLCSKPFPGAKIEDMLTWKGDYQKLERSHSYIQWLFPIPESRGMNYSAQPLQEHEAQMISEDEDLRNKVLQAFEMMLDFYGMELDLKAESVKRAENWKERYEHLNRSTHNHFRITRIIKALGELGWKNLQVPWIQFMMNEAIIKKELTKFTDKTMSHFIDAIKEEEEKWNQYAFMSDLYSHSRKQDEDREFAKQHESVITSVGTPDTSQKVLDTNSDKVSESDKSIEKTDESGKNEEKQENDNCEHTGDENTIEQESLNACDIVTETSVTPIDTDISKNDDVKSTIHEEDISETNKEEIDMSGSGNETKTDDEKSDSSDNTITCQKNNAINNDEEEHDGGKTKLSTKDTDQIKEHNPEWAIETLEIHKSDTSVDDTAKTNEIDSTGDKEADTTKAFNETDQDQYDKVNTKVEKEGSEKKVSKVEEIEGQDDRRKDGQKQGDTKKGKLKVEVKQGDDIKDKQKKDNKHVDNKVKKDFQHKDQGDTHKRKKDNDKPNKSEVVQMVSTV